MRSYPFELTKKQVAEIYNNGENEKKMRIADWYFVNGLWTHIVVDTKHIYVNGQALEVDNESGD